jgi:hypothetical protein
MKKLSSLAKSIFVAVVFVLVTFHTSWATHLRAGEITVTQVCPSRTFDICITVYVNTNPAETDVKFGGGTLRFGDGKTHTPPELNSTPYGDPQDFIGKVTYCVRWTYGAPGIYKISYTEVNRNADIRNMSNSVGTSFFLETILEIDPFKGCDNSPRLLVPPIDKACSGATWFHNPGAYDIDGDSLSYQMIVPRQGLEGGEVDEVGNYTLPNNPIHYVGKVGTRTLDYNNAQEDGDGTPLFNINPVTGTITWDAPGLTGEYNIAFLVIEWRKVDDVWLQIGSITRDMQIIVEDCPNKRPELEIPPDTCVVAGALIQVPIYGTDPDGDEVKIEVFSQTLILDVSPANYSPKDIFQSTTPQKAQITFTWQTECPHIKQQPYQVVFKITDKPANGGVKLVSFATWNITVVGPPPVWDQVTSAPNRSAQLNWDPYQCAAQADSMQIWRRIDSLTYDPICETGMPPGLGYEKIKTVKISQTSFLDTNDGKGLPPAAIVCYRLVATFPAPLGNTLGRTESLVSDQACLGPIPVDAPVMTHVTVDTTDRDKGRITVRWTPPFDLDPGDYPPPYKYDVYRAIGFSGGTSLTLVGTAKQEDTVVVDRLLNTFDNVYNYKVKTFDANGLPIVVPDDTLGGKSSTASSVRLSAKSLLARIELNWTAEVPWSLHSEINTKHVIYRGNENETEDQFVKIDSIESIGSLTYTDDGRWNSTPLEENQKYCYRVETRGGYGFNDLAKIPEPLINFSQIVCAQPSDTIPPCKPILNELSLSNAPCEEQFLLNGCLFNDFAIKLTWERPEDSDCSDDISFYRIYYSTKGSEDPSDYKLLVDLEDKPLQTFYIDENLPSFARCYRLVAVDRSGNESDWSDKVCGENCPNYELPNVFSPGNDECNEYFSAYSYRNIDDGKFLCDNSLVSDEQRLSLIERCPRFVLKVEAVIVDRWGKAVFNYTSGGENDIYIDWDGRDNKGRELSAGIYYYSVRVTYNMLKPEDREAVIKGWVHLVRPN